MMKYYKFKKDQDHYKKGEIIEVEKANKLLKEWIENKTIDSVAKPKEEKEIK